MTTLIIARHGNTFGPQDPVTYVGARTDLALVESGKAQARALGRYLKDNSLIPDVVYAGALKRAQETAQIAIKETGVSNPVYTLDIFNEIDYGPDENKTKAKVIARIGEKALQDWEENNMIPSGWKISAEEIIKNWQGFARQILKDCHPEGALATEGSQILPPAQGRGQDNNKNSEVILVVTSNGIARFAPHITGDYQSFLKKHNPKLATGAMGILVHAGNRWHVKDWNIRP